jgi:predicted DNA-binding transcriptional regulator AlpA
MDGIYMVKEVCWLLHVSRETIRRWECKGWFPKRIRFTLHASRSGPRWVSDVGRTRGIEARKAAAA